MATETPTSFAKFEYLSERALARAFGYPLPGGSQALAISTTVATSTVLPPQSTVQLTATADCFVQVSTATPGTASTTADMFLPAGTPMTFTLGLNNGSPYVYVSAITASGAGTLYITQMAGA
jgi:hypothetical protein